MKQKQAKNDLKWLKFASKNRKNVVLTGFIPSEQVSYKASVFVDGLRRNERFHFGVGLRKLKVAVKKVRGIRDESDQFIRLADAVAGFIRDSLEGDKVMRALQKEAEKNKIIKRI